MKGSAFYKYSVCDSFFTAIEFSGWMFPYWSAH